MSGQKRPSLDVTHIDSSSSEPDSDDMAAGNEDRPSKRQKLPAEPTPKPAALAKPAAPTKSAPKPKPTATVQSKLQPPAAPKITASAGIKSPDSTHLASPAPKKNTSSATEKALFASETAERETPQKISPASQEEADLVAAMEVESGLSLPASPLAAKKVAPKPRAKPAPKKLAVAKPSEPCSNSWEQLGKVLAASNQEVFKQWSQVATASEKSHIAFQQDLATQLGTSVADAVANSIGDAVTKMLDAQSAQTLAAHKMMEKQEARIESMQALFTKFVERKIKEVSENANAVKSLHAEITDMHDEMKATQETAEQRE